MRCATGYAFPVARVDGDEDREGAADVDREGTPAAAGGTPDGQHDGAAERKLSDGGDAQRKLSDGGDAERKLSDGCGSGTDARLRWLPEHPDWKPYPPQNVLALFGPM